MITILLNPETASDDKLIFEAKEKDILLGTIECHIDKDLLTIVKVSGEMFLIDGLCRTALNFAANRNVNKCAFLRQDKAVWDELIRLDFVQNNNKTIDDIDNFFTSHKSCKK